MSAFIIDQDTSLLTILDYAVNTRGLLAAKPYTAALALPFDTWLAQWKVVFPQEIDLRIATTSAAAREVSIDTDLNDLSDETDKTALILTKNNRDDAEYVFYFRGMRASVFKKPHMGAQLANMREWPPHMAASPAPAIVDLGVRVAVKVKEADLAIATTADAEWQAREFRLTGARKQLIDSLNALRKLTYGILAEMPHKQPELKLPGNFADRFFRAERPSAPSRPATAASLRIQMDAAQKEVDQLTRQYNEAAQTEAAAAAVKVTQDAAAKELADAEAALAKQQAAVDALKAKLGK